MTSSGASRTRETVALPRLIELDALRGLAALVVVVSHASASQRLSDNPEVATPTNVLGRLLRPWSVLADGDAAVVVFFVLSGLVLTLPFASSRRASPLRDWLAYYPSRVLRLMIPVWASLALAVVWFVAVPRVSGPSWSEWMSAHDRDLTLGHLMRAATLQQVPFINTPVWSLYWEMLFSLLLPVYAALVRRVRGPLGAWGLVGVALCSQLAGALDSPRWVPVLGQFLLGAGLGALLSIRSRGLSQMAWWRTVLVGLMLVLVARAMGDMPGAGSDVAPAVLLGGCGMVVWAFARARGTVRWIRSRWATWLGAISYSLYLVHEPLVVSLGILMPRLPVWGFALISVALSLALAGVFYRLVERPAHRVSRRVRTLVLAR